MILRRAGVSLLVGAILMAPSVASAAPALVFEGFKRYFWKSLFDRLAIQAPLSNSPTHLRDSVCGIARAKSTVRRSVKSKAAGTRSPGVPAPASAVSASEAN
jgi:hypothetical protein